MSIEERIEKYMDSNLGEGVDQIDKYQKQVYTASMRLRKSLVELKHSDDLAGALAKCEDFFDSIDRGDIGVAIRLIKGKG